jgi:hypothetical protein
LLAGKLCRNSLGALRAPACLLSPQAAALTHRAWCLPPTRMPVALPAGGDPLPPQLYASGCQIYCAKGDVSAVEEAAYIMSAAGSATDKPLRGIMHAGAVLDSKVIANISTASIRTEYSGGYCGAGWHASGCHA